MTNRVNFFPLLISDVFYSIWGDLNCIETVAFQRTHCLITEKWQNVYVFFPEKIKVKFNMKIAWKTDSLILQVVRWF